MLIWNINIYDMLEKILWNFLCIYLGEGKGGGGFTNACIVWEHIALMHPRILNWNIPIVCCSDWFHKYGSNAFLLIICLEI